MSNPTKDSYAQAGVDTSQASSALSRLTSVLAQINPGRPSRVAVGAGHYATVLEVGQNLGIALSADGVGTKVIIAEQLHKFDTVGIDCIAMNVNDIICVGADPIALVDYLAVEVVDGDVLEQIAIGLKAGAELAGIEIPGGELAQLPEVIRGHPSPNGFDLAGACFGTVALDAIISGEAVAPGDTIIGLPSNGLHSNGYTLARKVLLDSGGLTLDSTPGELSRTLGEELLQPTEIYVPAVRELLDSGCTVHGLAHITGDGLWNLPRINDKVSYTVDQPLDVPPIFALIQKLGGLATEEMYRVFNMGVGFCVIVPRGDTDTALALLQGHYTGANVIGSVTDGPGVVSLGAHS